MRWFGVTVRAWRGANARASRRAFMRERLVLLIALVAPCAYASDGVLEINQTCAVLTGCIDNSGGIGDTPGFPVTIEVPGSYVMTSNLTVSDPNMDGLFIATAPVTIDLNGFEIQRPVNCIGLGSTLTCDAGTGRGIRSSFVRTTVVNGSVIKFGSDGIQLGGRSRIERVVVERNGGNGIDVGDDSIVIGCRAYRNGGSGIDSNLASIVEGSTSASNHYEGFSMGSGAAISGSTARDNGATGIIVRNGSTVSDNSAYRNENRGILVFDKSTISGNTAYLNGGIGIQGLLGSTVQGNTVGSNGDVGISLESTSTYRENTITGNSTGAVSGGVNLGDNYCEGTGVVMPACP
jgi:hypothetical protein